MIAVKLHRAAAALLFIPAIFLGGLGFARPALAHGSGRLPVRPAESPPAALDFTCGRPLRIMPLGDSITRGSSSGTPKDPQYYVSYRRDLYLRLLAKGVSIDFVGSQGTDGAAYSDFDRDHEGWPGKRDEYIAQNIYSWLAANPADLILLHIGTNDMDPANPDPRAADVERILQEIDRFDPQVWVIAARILQRVPYDANTEAYNDKVDALLVGRIAAGDRLLRVDMENGAGIVYAQYPAGDMYDDKHPYAAGYAKMAAAWEAALLDLLPACGCLPGQANASCPVTLFLPVVVVSP